MKRFLSLFIALILLLSIVPTVLAENGSMSNFRKTKTYKDGQFSDVSAYDWFAPSVKEAYEYGLVKGNTRTTYNPNGNITIAETLVLACRLHKLFTTGDGSFKQGSPWYQCYWDYALSNQLLTAADHAAYQTGSTPITDAQILYFTSKPATRAFFAGILCRALPNSALGQINAINDNTIPDVAMNTANTFEPCYANEIYTLYRAGVLTGNDKYGYFTPAANIQRSAVSAIVTRMVNPSLRKTFSFAVKPAVVDLKSYAKGALAQLKDDVIFPPTLQVHGVYGVSHVSSVDGHQKVVILIDYSAQTRGGRMRRDIYPSVYDLTSGRTLHDALDTYYTDWYPQKPPLDLELGFELDDMISNYTSYTQIYVS